MRKKDFEVASLDDDGSNFLNIDASFYLAPADFRKIASKDSLAMRVKETGEIVISDQIQGIIRGLEILSDADFHRGTPVDNYNVS